MTFGHRFFEWMGSGGVEISQLASLTSRQASFKGHGRCRAADVRAVPGLDVVPETDPHPLHADIVGWPAKREKRLELAQMLATRAAYVPVAREPSLT